MMRCHCAAVMQLSPRGLVTNVKLTPAKHGGEWASGKPPAKYGGEWASGKPPAKYGRERTISEEVCEQDGGGESGEPYHTLRRQGGGGQRLAQVRHQANPSQGVERSGANQCDRCVGISRSRYGGDYEAIRDHRGSSRVIMGSLWGHQWSLWGHYGVIMRAIRRAIRGKPEASRGKVEGQS